MSDNSLLPFTGVDSVRLAQGGDNAIEPYGADLDRGVLLDVTNADDIDQIILRLPIADPTIAGDVVTFDLI